jgi:hypothetical protein
MAARRFLRWEPDRYPDEPDPTLAKIDAAEQIAVDSL